MANISDKENKADYWKFMNNWNKKAQESVPDSLRNRYFNNKGHKILKIFSIVMIAVAVLLIIYGFISNIIMAMAGIIVLIEAIILLCIPNNIFGKWTKEGKECHDKWMNFKNYITDYSLINEKPPESVQVWGKYLVYAAALGYANSATNTMKDYFRMQDVSSDSFRDNDVILFTYHGGFRQMDSSFATFQTSDSDTGGSGGIGSAGSGGFGGGGGGTF